MRVNRSILQDRMSTETSRDMRQEMLTPLRHNKGGKQQINALV